MRCVFAIRNNLQKINFYYIYIFDTHMRTAFNLFSISTYLLYCFTYKLKLVTEIDKCASKKDKTAFLRILHATWVFWNHVVLLPYMFTNHLHWFYFDKKNLSKTRFSVWNGFHNNTKMIPIKLNLMHIHTFHFFIIIFVRFSRFFRSTSQFLFFSFSFYLCCYSQVIIFILIHRLLILLIHYQ